MTTMNELVSVSIETTNNNNNNEIINNDKFNNEDDHIHKLKQRQKQIDIGKKSIGYINLMNQIQFIDKKDMVRVPNINQNCSKRSFDGQIKKWKQFLHKFDNSDSNSSYIESDSDSSTISTCSTCSNNIEISANEI